MYRDDAEAAHHRADALQRELDRTRDDLDGTRRALELARSHRCAEPVTPIAAIESARREPRRVPAARIAAIIVGFLILVIAFAVTVSVTSPGPK